MGWASGSEIAEDVWTNVKPYVAPECQRELARVLVSIFENNDCDTMQEAETLWEDAGLNESPSSESTDE